MSKAEAYWETLSREQRLSIWRRAGFVEAYSAITLADIRRELPGVAAKLQSTFETDTAYRVFKA